MITERIVGSNRRGDDPVDYLHQLWGTSSSLGTESDLAAVHGKRLLHVDGEASEGRTMHGSGLEYSFLKSHGLERGKNERFGEDE